MADINALYSRADGIGHYTIPELELETKKTSYTLNLWTHLANAAKAETITLPVSQSFYDSVRVGEELTSKFNTTKAIRDREFEKYKTTVKNKTHGDLYCAFLNGKCMEIDAQTFNGLKYINQQRFEMQQVGKDVFVKSGSTALKNAAEQGCNVVIESQKTNFTLDAWKHVANSFNKMQLTLGLPGFMCENIKPGDTIDRSFVGASLFFSKSPSMVSYRVIDVRK